MSFYIKKSPPPKKKHTKKTPPKHNTEIDNRTNAKNPPNMIKNARLKRKWVYIDLLSNICMLVLYMKHLIAELIVISA